MKRIFMLFLTLELLSCNGKPDRATQMLAEGVNGPTIYVYDKDGKMKMAYVEKYAVPGFTIFINDDTVKLGSEFSSYFSVAMDTFEITVTEPSDTVILSPTKRYYFTPSQPGLYQFKGKIEMNTTTVPFDYKFIVTP